MRRAVRVRVCAGSYNIEESDPLNLEGARPRGLPEADRFGWRKGHPVTTSHSPTDGDNRYREPPRPVGVPTIPPRFDEWQIELHGRRMIYRVAGSGPPVVLI